MLEVWLFIIIILEFSHIAQDLLAPGIAITYTVHGTCIMLPLYIQAVLYMITHTADIMFRTDIRMDTTDNITETDTTMDTLMVEEIFTDQEVGYIIKTVELR
tara:strand:+ start:15 stop:320 length:306 start_codon:yes stop_codon:yes gene_type:complete